MMRISVLVGFFLLLAGLGWSQPKMAERRESPLELATYRHHNAYIKITYGRPFRKGRDIFGGLVPYGEVWRTGANEATELTSTGNLMFGGKFVKAGTYSLFTIPREKTWIIILNKAVGQFGAFEYDRTKDLVRVEVPVKYFEDREDFLIDFSPSNKEKEVILFFWWGTTRVEVPIGLLN